ncbi:MAG: hypothetical protein ACPGLV_01620, partial [Bacteroidia bacterium]
IRSMKGLLKFSFAIGLLSSLSFLFQSCNGDENIVFEDKYPITEPDFEFSVRYNTVSLKNTSINYDTLYWDAERRGILYGETQEFKFDYPGSYDVTLHAGYGKYFKEKRKTIFIEKVAPSPIALEVRGPKWYDSKVIISNVPDENYTTISSVLSISTNTEFSDPVRGRATIVRGDTFNYDSQIDLTNSYYDGKVSVDFPELRPSTEYYFKLFHVFRGNNSGLLDTLESAIASFTTEDFVETVFNLSNDMSDLETDLVYQFTKALTSGRKLLNQKIEFSFDPQFSTLITPHGLEKSSNKYTAFSLHANTRIYARCTTSMIQFPDVYVVDTVSVKSYNSFYSQSFKIKNLNSEKVGSGFKIWGQAPNGVEPFITFNLPNYNSNEEGYEIESTESIDSKNYSSLEYNYGFIGYSGHVNPCVVKSWTYDNQKFFFIPITTEGYDRKRMRFINPETKTGAQIDKIVFSIE